MTRALRVCLVNDSSVNPNWGCRATSSALKGLITAGGSQIVATITLDQLLTLSLSDRSSWARMLDKIDPFVPRRPIVRELLGRAVDNVRHKLPDVAPSDVSQFDTLADALVRGDVLGYAKVAFSACDAVVVNGEGGIYGFKRESRLMLFLAYVAKRYFGLRVAIVNHTAELSDPRLRAMAQLVYPLVDDVVFREPISARTYGELAGENVAPDAAFMHRPDDSGHVRDVSSRSGYYSVWPDEAVFDMAEPYVVLGGSALFAKREVGGARLDGLVRLAAELGRRVAPVVLTASDVPDETVFRVLAHALGLPVISLRLPVQQALDVLGNAVAYVGGRWHPAIFAASGGTPFVPLATNGHKLAGLAEMFDLPAPGTDLSHLESAGVSEIVGLVEDHVRSGGALRDRLANVSREFGPASKRHVAVLDEQVADRVG